MDVGDHGTDVPRAVRRLAVLGIFDAVQVVDDWLMEVHRVSFVERIDFSSRWNFDLEEA